MNENEQYITHDAVVQSSVTFDDEVDGVTVDSEGETTIDWDTVERVSLQSTDSFSTVPHGMAFDSEEFYRLRATVAKPIPQPYIINDSTVWLKKPRAELQRAAWSLDNRPWTMGHPDTGLVSDVDDVRGFWDDSYYNETTDDLKSHLYVPVGDDEAKDFIEDNNDVSVGFRNRVTSVENYDKPVGGVGPDVNDEYEREIELDGYQTEMYFDHVASVEQGRCSGEDGCGLDSSGTAYKGTVITNFDENAQTSVLTQKQQMADQSHTHEGSWYAVTPDENPDDEYKYVIDNCSDAEDAWQLRHHGDIDISVETLADRIRQRASDLGCDIEFNTDNMTDCGCNDGGMNIDFDDLSPEVALDKIAAENDSIDAELTDLRQKASVAEDAADELDIDIEQVADKAAMLDERVEELTETVDELQRPKMEEDAEVIIEETDRFGETVEEVIEACDEDPESVAEKRELVEDLATTDTSETTANADSTPDDEITVNDGPAVTPWE